MLRLKEQKRGLKRRFMGVVKADMRVVGVSKDDVNNRIRWRNRICCGAAKRHRYILKISFCYSMLNIWKNVKHIFKSKLIFTNA